MVWTAVLAGAVVAAVLAIAIFALVMDTRCSNCHAWMSRRAYYCRVCGEPRRSSGSDST